MTYTPEQKRAWWLKNKERLRIERRAYFREYAKRNLKRRRIRMAKYREKNRERLREYHRALARRLRREVLEHYSGGSPPRCACCGETEDAFLTLDHINGVPPEEKRQTVRGNQRRRTGLVLCKWLRRTGYPKNFRVLCWNCNCGRAKLGICPHER